MGKCKDWGFHLFLFLVPIFYIPNMVDTRIVQERFFQAAVMGLASLFFRNIWLTLFMWLNLILFAVKGASVGGSQVLNCFLTGILFLIARSYFKDRPITPYVKTLVGVACLSILFMCLQSFGVDPIHVGMGPGGEVLWNESFRLRTGLFFLPPFNAAFMAIVASLLAFTGSWMGLLLILPALDSRSSAALLAFTFLLIFWSYWRWREGRKRHIWKGVAVAMCLGFLGYTALDLKGDRLTYLSRFESWHLILKKIGENPLGYGPDSFRSYTPTKNFKFQTDEEYNPMICERVDANTERVSYHSADPGQKITRFKGRIPKSFGEWTEAHNEYLEGTFQYGLPVLILIAGLFREILRRFRRSLKTREVLGLFACLVTYALLSTTQFPFHLARLSGIFGLLLGAFYAKTEEVA